MLDEGLKFAVGDLKPVEFEIPSSSKFFFFLGGGVYTIKDSNLCTGYRLDLATELNLHCINFRIEVKLLKSEKKIH